MEYKKIRLIIFAVIAFTILTKDLTITVSKNYFKVKSTAHSTVDCTVYVLLLGSQLDKTNNGK